MIPTEAYIVMVDGTWPVNVLINDNDGIIASRVWDAVEARAARDERLTSQVRVYRVQLTDPVEMSITGPQQVGATLTVKDIDFTLLNHRCEQVPEHGPHKWPLPGAGRFWCDGKVTTEGAELT